MPQEVKFSMNFESNLKELINGLKEAKSEIENLRKTSSSTTGGASYPKQWRKGLMPGGMSLQEMYMGGQTGSLASGIAKAPNGSAGSGGGTMGALGMGAMAGMAAAGVLLLVKALKDTLAQSKIANAFLGTLSKLLGLLIDVVLLPFVPLLIAVLILLSSAIMLLYGVMSKLNPFSGGSGSGSAGGATLDYIALAGAIAAALVAAIIAALIGGSALWSVLGVALVGILTYYLVLAAYAGGAALGKALQYYVMEFILWLDGAASTISAAWKTFTDWLGGIPAWAETQWKTFTDWLGGVASTVSGLWKGFMDSLTGWFTNLYNNPLIKWLSSMLGSSSTATSTSSSGQTGGLDIGLPTSSKSTTSSNTFNIVGAASADANAIINFIQSAFFRAGSQSPGQGSNS